MPSLNSPIITGDVSGGLHSTKVEKLQNNAVAATAPTSGQVLTWDGSQWAPAASTGGGGGGANGLTYYLRQDVAADEPTTNIPGTPKQLGRTGAVAQTSITSGTLTTDVWTLLGGYVSESVPLDPNIAAIPGGLWDFNVWALGTANANAATVIRAKAYTYNGTDAPTLLGTSGEQVINNVSAQFSLSVLVPQTTVTSTTRIYVAVEVKAVANGHTATLQFGDGTPSHVHTSLPLVGGTGLWKNVAGVLQSPASLLVDADVDAAAAIAQSKISGLTTDLAAKAAKTVVEIFTSNGTWTKPAGAVAVEVHVISGGGGGASGRKGGAGTVAPGGGGGGGGSYSIRSFAATLLGPTEAVTVGLGGAGGVAQTNNNTNGLLGGPGGNSSFGSWVATTGGGGAGAVTTASGPAGASASSRAIFLGANGGAGSVGASPGTNGINSIAGAAGGGGGGGLTLTTPIPIAGGAGGCALASFIAGGIAPAGTAGGGNGQAGPAATANTAIPGSGGAGGGSSTSVANGGNGGAGGLYGGGGGGGGAGLDAVNNSGAGGNGAPGIVIVTTYF